MAAPNACVKKSSSALSGSPLRAAVGISYRKVISPQSVSTASDPAQACSALTLFTNATNASRRGFGTRSGMQHTMPTTSESTPTTHPNMDKADSSVPYTPVKKREPSISFSQKSISACRRYSLTHAMPLLRTSSSAFSCASSTRFFFVFRLAILHSHINYSFSHFDQRGQVIAGVRDWPFNAMHGAGPASAFT